MALLCCSLPAANSNACLNQLNPFSVKSCSTAIALNPCSVCADMVAGASAISAIIIA